MYPLLLLNTAFRLAFSVYKSSFAFFCMHSFGYGAAEVGLALSLMGLLGIFVQGVLLRLVVAAARDGSALCLGLLATSLGLALLSAAHSAPLLVLSLGLITVGYGLCVPSLSALFSHVPMQQGVMQGIAGSADRLGQAIGAAQRARERRAALVPRPRGGLRARAPPTSAPLRVACSCHPLAAVQVRLRACSCSAAWASAG